MLPDRMPPLDAAQMDAGQKAAFDEIVGGRRGALYGPFVPAGSSRSSAPPC